MGAVDPTSFSDPNVAETKKIDLNWEVDFEAHTISGNVDLKLEIKQDDPASLTLDTRDLTIHSVSVKDGAQLKFSLKEKHKSFGTALEINLPGNLKKGSTLVLHIEYKTSPEASALQWLKPEQTAGKQHPYLFSQCQAIHARSIVPCQDTPGVKAPYTAKITVKDPLVALMSAVGTGKKSLGNGKTEYAFEQKVPMPSYLIAVVVGALESRDIGPRSKVWSETEFVEKAAEEFSQTEQFLAAGESLVGPYVWGRYDLLVLPPSFPYGGMENPCLTFVTPTLLAGDKSLANIDVFGETNPLTNLVPKLIDIDPDDAFSSVPYEKGHTLLYYLETLLGGPGEFEPFLHAYIDKFKYSALTTDEWKAFLYEFFEKKGKKDLLDKVDWNAWFNTPGMPPVIPDYSTSLSTDCSALADRWSKASQSDLASFKSSDVTNFRPWQVIDFLGQLILKDPLTPAHIAEMDKLYKFSSSGNSEIKFRWLRLGLRAQCESAVQPALQMVTEQGRMKYTRPLYRDLGGWDRSRQRAVDTFGKNRCFMHNTTAQLIQKDLKL